MAQLTLPAGSSVRDIAARLGVSVQALLEHASSHAGVHDAETPMPIDTAIIIPDGFLREADRSRRTQYAAVPMKHTPQQGMNASMAINLEFQRRILHTDDQGRQPAASLNESDGLQEARNAYVRMEAQANTLSYDLYKVFTGSKNAEVRAIAGAGCALSKAHGFMLFGSPLRANKIAALSLAKTAIIADPEQPMAIVALGLAQCLEENEPNAPKSDEWKAGIANIRRALTLQPQYSEAWYSLAWANRHEPEEALLALQQVDLDDNADMNPAALALEVEIRLPKARTPAALGHLQKRLQESSTAAPHSLHLKVLDAATQARRDGKNTNIKSIEAILRGIKNQRYRAVLVELFTSLVNS